MKGLAALLAIPLTLLSFGCDQGQPIEIDAPPATTLPVGEVYIGGAVNVPGIYPLKAGDTIEALLHAAGGASTGGDLTLSISVSSEAELKTPQKVNINRADAWLLEALPGVGQTKAQAIIDYRQQHGPFKSTSAIQQVEGFGAAIYEQIKNLITVTD